MRRLLLALSATLALATPAWAQVKLEVGYIPVTGVSQIFIIANEGWDKQAGLDLHITRFDSGPAMIQALASGKLDVLYAGVTPMIVARTSDIGVQVLAATATEEIALVGRGAYADELAKAKGDPRVAIAAFNKSQGRRLKVSTQPAGSVPDTVVRYWLGEVAKIPAAEVEVLGMGIDKTQQALLAKAVDVAAIREPVITIVRDLDPEVKIVATGGEVFPGQPGSVLAVRTEARARNPEAIDKLVALHVRATKLLQSEPKKAAPAVHKFLSDGLTSLDTIERALAAPTSKFVADPAVIRGSVQKMQDFQVAQGTLPKALDLNLLFDEGPYKKAAASQ